MLSILNAIHTVTRTPIDRCIEASARPFRPAVEAIAAESRRDAGTQVWRAFTTATFDVLLEHWHRGVGVELNDAEVVLVTASTAPYVHLEVVAAREPIHPMQVRSAVQLVGRLRPAIRREAPVSTWEIDGVTNSVLIETRRHLPVADPELGHEFDRIIHRRIARRGAP